MGVRDYLRLVLGEVVLKVGGKPTVLRKTIPFEGGA
jgi:hypothetical protein